MKISKKKQYRYRNGLKAELITVDYPSHFPVRTLTPNKVLFRHRADGTCWYGRAYDLIEEKNCNTQTEGTK